MTNSQVKRTMITQKTISKIRCISSVTGNNDSENPRAEYSIFTNPKKYNRINENVEKLSAFLIGDETTTVDKIQPL